MNKKISIIIPNYFQNKPGKIITDSDEQLWFARECFVRIQKYTKIPYELILIDNGCVHGHKILEEFADILIRNKENLGFAKGVNQGVSLSTGDMVAVVNNDIWVWEGWIEALLKTFEDNFNCGVAMTALFKETKDPIEVLKIKKPNLTQNYNAYGAGAEFGSCWMMKRETIKKIKDINDGYMFDENFKIGMGEDRRLWEQVRKLGLETYRTHKTRVYHAGNRTMGNIPNRRQYTVPNREYLRRIRKIEEAGEVLTLERKKEIREQVDIDYKNGVFTE